jgi:hypothetical protein
MGTITRSFANNITTSGVLLPASLTNNSIANVTAYNAAIATGSMVLISSQTASNSASISFTTGINSTYKEYQFYFVNIAPRDADKFFQFQTSTDGGSNYGVTATTTNFRSYHFESDGGAGLGYETVYDLAQSTAEIYLTQDVGNTADYNLGGFLQIYNPASTTYVKHFLTQVSTDYVNATPGNLYVFNAGYFNTTSAINAVRFKMSAGNIDGTILMYGIV